MSTYANELIIRYVCGMRSAVDFEKNGGVSRQK